MDANNNEGMNDEDYLVIENPDKTLLVGSQPHLRDRKVVVCWSCKSYLLCSMDAKIVQCINCNELNGVPGMNLSENERTIIITCYSCKKNLKVFANCILCKCPSCLTINNVSSHTLQ
eukprot:TRINITY_DN3179_c0_g1_i1.p1 TRINITY_DN3179_c0_g1~~TRINITY_DN3179_c0_g1_i1.p1  ORF type:complete len:117 (-),score=7.59 TRINITY_DN3179_c0_g1_i1:29-379(-)